MSGRSDEFARQIFRAAQQPVAWLYSASRLRNGAEAILKHELPVETPYLNAVYAAEEEADAIANSSANDSGAAEIKAVPPNYPPAQLLYAYAIENVLKGLIISKRPRLVDDEALTKQLATHDLTKLAANADFTVHAQERPVLKSLSQLSRWAGRLPRPPDSIRICVSGECRPIVGLWVAPSIYARIL